MNRPQYVIQAPAKINLSLAVGPCRRSPLGPRHPICTWIVRTDLTDQLTLTALDDDYFSRYAIIWADDARHKSPIEWSVTRDLAVRAHALLEHHVGRRLPLQLKLKKRIPVRSGMGGGSSNAAAMLFGCNRLFDLGLTIDELQDLAGHLGSDVHFFLAGVPCATAHGFGEIVEPGPTPAEPINVVAFMPQNVQCPTAEVYRHFDTLRADDDLSEQTALYERGSATVRQLAGSNRPTFDRLFNDLGPPALDLMPELKQVREAVQQMADLPVHMTGSGAAMFVICDDRLHAEYLATAITRQHGHAAWALRAGADLPDG